MKKLRLVIVVVLLVIFALENTKAQNWTNENHFWTQFKNGFINRENYNFSAYNQDIRIQITGNILHEDTLYADKLIVGLSGLIKKVNIYRVKTGGNLVLNFKEVSDSFYFKKYGPNPKIISSLKSFLDTVKLEFILSHQKKTNDITIKNINNYFIFIKEHTSCTQNKNEIRNTNIQFYFRKATPQIIRNKLIAYYIITSLVNKNYSIYQQSEADASFQSATPLTSQFQELDSFIISKAYSNDIQLQIFKRYPRITLERLKHRYGDYTLLAYFTICLVIIMIYILLLFKLKVIEAVTNSWETFMKKGMLLMQSATFMYLLKNLYESNLYHHYSKFSFILILIILPNIFSFLSLNIIYLLEKILIHKNLSIGQKLYIQLCTSLVPVILFIATVYMFSGLSNNVLFISFMVIYGFLMVIGRISYSFFHFTAQNTIQQKDLELSTLREMQQKAELQALHSRINPHFLYNALNSIAGLAKTDADKTEKMALALSDFCRYAMNKSNDTFATVAEEITIAQTYLEIEKTRFGENLFVEIMIDADIQEVKIPRFLIQPLVENAIKHGVSKITECGHIRLIVSKQHLGLTIFVYDNGPAFSESPISGYGLQSIFDKLEIIYKGKAKINWQNAPDKNIAIFIPISEKLANQ